VTIAPNVLVLKRTCRPEDAELVELDDATGELTYRLGRDRHLDPSGRRTVPDMWASRCSTCHTRQRGAVERSGCRRVTHVFGSIASVLRRSATAFARTAVSVAPALAGMLPADLDELGFSGLSQRLLA